MNYTPNQLKQAYQIVIADLFYRLCQAQDEESIRFGNLGKFKKKEKIVNSKQYGRHVYYQLSFSCFSNLKKAFHQQLNKKYHLK